MNKTYIYIFIALATLLGASSCTKDFEAKNRPGGALSADEMMRDNYVLGAFIVQLQNQAFPEQENAYQMNVDLIGNYCGRFMTYANNGFSNNNFAKMNAPDGWVRYPFADCTPKVSAAFREIALRTEESGIVYAIALVLRAQALHRLTDMYGPYPIGLEADENAYSSQEAVYKSLLADLEKATSILAPIAAANPSATVLADQDQCYGGNIAKWNRFANSLKLRMAIRMRFADPTLAQSVAESAVLAGVMTSNDDNLAITYFPNGQYKTSVDWGDSRACADIDAYMNGYNDPRIEKYFKPAATLAAGSRSVIGIPAAANVGNKANAVLWYSAANINADSKGVWMTAAEMSFCRAEGALAGWNMGGTAEELYNQAITLSFEQWGAGSAEQYLADATATQQNYTNVTGGYGGNYPAVSNITIKWDENDTEERKLERLITQKWIALFPEGHEAWCEIRRTGYPHVFPVAQTVSYDIKVPNRIPFAPDEATRNRDNYNKAVSLLGGADNYGTKMWWQR